MDGYGRSGQVGILGRVGRAGTDGAETGLQRIGLAIEQRGIINRIAHYFFDVVAGFAERDGFGVDSAFQRTVGSPLLGPAGAGVIGGRGENRVVVEVFHDQAHVGGAEQDVGFGVVYLALAEIAQADLLGYTLGGGRHQLHQAGGADVGLGTGDEAAFLTHQTVNPGVVERLVAGGRAHLIAV